MDNITDTNVQESADAVSEIETPLVSRENAVKEHESRLSATEAELDVREAALQKRSDEVTELEKSLLANIDELEKTRQQLNVRAEEIARRELEARNGFPALFEERFSAVIAQITARETAVAEREKALNEKSVELAELELRAKNGFQSFFEERFAEQINLIVARENAVSELENAIARKEEERRIKLNADAEKAAEDISARQRDVADKLRSDVAAEREKLYIALEDEISKLREQRLASLQKEIDGQRAGIEAIKGEQAEKEKSLRQFESELNACETRLDSRKNDLDDKKRFLDEKIAGREAEIKSQYDHRVSELEIAREDLIKQLRAKSAEINASEQFRASLGGKDVAVIKNEIQQKDDRIRKLSEEIEKRPPESLRDDYDRLRKTSENLSRENGELKDKQVKADEVSRSFNTLQRENQVLKFDNEFLKDRNATIEAELERLNTSKNPIDKGKRIEAIEQPVITLVRNGSEPSGTVEKSVNDMTEIEWLQNISKGCTDHGLVFPQRILWAYHTALKTAEMSPITVLAGVSGTGKSELPKLYAYFGGLNFMPVSVQPNWDSQESMLGYFNSIDNRFDAQPLLRFLAQGAKKTEKDSEFITGLRKYVNLVLLDEMNLAHVEYYFAEFLSKLEDRRSKGRNEEPQLEVKLGSGIEPHMLNMVRNVLWTGTMNQDETTKSLSDKVLDRGIVINFPRPIELKSRVELKTLAPNNDAASKLLYVTWMGTEERKGFVKRKNYFETESNDKGKKLMDDAKKLVEEINRCLSIAGRAVGHRVWQSVEYYILNYPSVVAAHESGTKLDSAFTVALEDQIVQKIMPKLRGIEIRGRQKTECLDRTRVILEDHSLNLTEDFNFACEAGYGQFMWNSAYYIDKSGIGSTTSAGEPRNEEGNDDSGNELTDDGQ